MEEYLEDSTSEGKLDHPGAVNKKLVEIDVAARKAAAKVERSSNVSEDPATENNTLENSSEKTEASDIEIHAFKDNDEDMKEALKKKNNEIKLTRSFLKKKKVR